MKRVNANILEFLDQWVTREIVRKYGLSEREALERLMFSKTYQMLVDYETGVYLMSPKIIFDMWECEQITADPRNSTYIREG